MWTLARRRDDIRASVSRWLVCLQAYQAEMKNLLLLDSEVHALLTRFYERLAISPRNTACFRRIV
jgi:hypothetical protein